MRRLAGVHAAFCLLAATLCGLFACSGRVAPPLIERPLYVVCCVEDQCRSAPDAVACFRLGGVPVSGCDACGPGYAGPPPALTSASD